MYTERFFRDGRRYDAAAGANRSVRAHGFSTGFTLIEMIVILVVVSIVAVALFGVIASSMTRSVDPMIRMQAIAIAQGYLEEALLQPYAEPPDGAGESNGCELSETRSTYDDVQDYDCIDNELPTDQSGLVQPSLSDYKVEVVVGGVTVNGRLMMQVDVTVTHDRFDTTLTGYRGNY